MRRGAVWILAAFWLISGALPPTLAASRPAGRKSGAGSARKKVARPVKKEKTTARRAPSARKKRLLRAVQRSRKRALRTPRSPRRYIRSFSALVTAYVPINTPMEGGRWTCTMRDGWKTHGIAVDPRYIPLGSLLYVPGYGRALADDTGGRIKRNHIDVRQHSIRAMHRWGVKKLRVYVLKHPKKKKRTRRTLSA
jgi:3D (Asp-Asp-Asp) domain-containing protein